MDETWFWHRFLDLANVPLRSAITEAAEAVDGNVQIFVSCGMLVPGQKWAQVLFDVDENALSQKMHYAADGILDELAGCTTFSGIADGLRALDGSSASWQWIDILAGHSFSLDVDGPDHTGACAQMLKAFSPWMR